MSSSIVRTTCQIAFSFSVLFLILSFTSQDNTYVVGSNTPTYKPNNNEESSGRSTDKSWWDLSSWQDMIYNTLYGSSTEEGGGQTTDRDRSSPTSRSTRQSRSPATPLSTKRAPVNYNKPTTQEDGDNNNNYYDLHGDDTLKVQRGIRNAPSAPPVSSELNNNNEDNEVILDPKSFSIELQDKVREKVLEKISERMANTIVDMMFENSGISSSSSSSTTTTTTTVPISENTKEDEEIVDHETPATAVSVDNSPASAINEKENIAETANTTTTTVVDDEDEANTDASTPSSDNKSEEEPVSKEVVEEREEEEREKIEVDDSSSIEAEDTMTKDVEDAVSESSQPDVTTGRPGKEQETEAPTTRTPETDDVVPTEETEEEKVDSGTDEIIETEEESESEPDIIPQEANIDNDDESTATTTETRQQEEEEVKTEANGIPVKISPKTSDELQTEPDGSPSPGPADVETQTKAQEADDTDRMVDTLAEDGEHIADEPVGGNNSRDNIELPHDTTSSGPGNEEDKVESIGEERSTYVDEVEKESSVTEGSDADSGEPDEAKEDVNNTQPPSTSESIEMEEESETLKPPFEKPLIDALNVTADTVSNKPIPNEADTTEDQAEDAKDAIDTPTDADESDTKDRVSDAEELQKESESIVNGTIPETSNTTTEMETNTGDKERKEEDESELLIDFDEIDEIEKGSETKKPIMESSQKTDESNLKTESSHIDFVSENVDVDTGAASTNEDVETTSEPKSSGSDKEEVTTDAAGIDQDLEAVSKGKSSESDTESLGTPQQETDSVGSQSSQSQKKESSSDTIETPQEKATKPTAPVPTPDSAETKPKKAGSLADFFEKASSRTNDLGGIAAKPKQRQMPHSTNVDQRGTQAKDNLSRSEDNAKQYRKSSENSAEAAFPTETKAKSVNTDFVEGLDDIDKFMEPVDPPDELDVAAGSSIQEVLVGKGALILTKRVAMATKRVRKHVSNFLARFKDEDGNFAFVDSGKEQLSELKDKLLKLKEELFEDSQELLDDLMFWKKKSNRDESGEDLAFGEENEKIANLHQMLQQKRQATERESIGYQRPTRTREDIERFMQQQRLSEQNEES